MNTFGSHLKIAAHPHFVNKVSHGRVVLLATLALFSITIQCRLGVANGASLTGVWAFNLLDATGAGGSRNVWNTRRDDLYNIFIAKGTPGSRPDYNSPLVNGPNDENVGIGIFLQPGT